MSAPGADGAGESAASAGEPEAQPGGEPDGEAPGQAPESGSGSGQPAANGTGQNAERPGQRPWNGNASGPPAGDKDGAADAREDANVSEPAEESLDKRYDERESQWSWVRSDFPTRGGPVFDLRGPGTGIRDIAGHDINNFSTYVNWGETRARGPIGAVHLARAAQVHVRTGSDARLAQACREDQLVFLRGRSESGRRSSAIVVLDGLTGRERSESRVTVLEAAAGLGGLAGRLVKGHGHLVDASTADWIEVVSEAQIAETQEALGPGGYLIVLIDASTNGSLPSTVVDHQAPDLDQVINSHLAAKVTVSRDRLAINRSQVTEEDRAAARGLVQAAVAISADAAEWRGEIIGQPSGSSAVPADAVHFAEAIWAWRAQHADDPRAVPEIRAYRELRLSQRARSLLQRGNRDDSPLRQAYVISAAVLDGLAVSEVADGARQLAVLLQEVEHPGETEGRRIFAEPLARWLSHVAMTALMAEPDKRGTGNGIAHVKMPSRHLARAVIEVAWRDYDAARLPMLGWLAHLCGGHPDERVRIRAAQALAVIAGHDYPQIRDRVLLPWSESGKPVEHQAAAWLLEAATLDGTVADQVKTLLWRWSHSGDRGKRAIAVRAYGTAASQSAQDQAIRGVRFSAADVTFGSLPELALREMYVLGLREKVLQELTFWTRAFLPMRERVGRVLVRLSRVRRPGDDGTPPSFDLLWRMAHEPDKAGIDLATLAVLWKHACLQPGSRGAAWQMLGLWAQSCRDQPVLRTTFNQLISEFEQVADQAELRARLRVYRRRWSTYLGQEDHGER